MSPQRQSHTHTWSYREVTKKALALVYNNSGTPAGWAHTSLRGHQHQPGYGSPTHILIPLHAVVTVVLIIVRFPFLPSHAPVVVVAYRFTLSSASGCTTCTDEAALCNMVQHGKHPGRAHVLKCKNSTLAYLTTVVCTMVRVCVCLVLSF